MLTMPLVLLTIVAAGVFGGLVNYYLAKPDDVPPPSLRRSVVVGLAASFLVPLFLNMISSNLIDLIRAGDGSKLLILLGFCLVAAISSTAFIRTLSDRVLSEAKQATRQARETRAELLQVQQDIEPIVAKETEGDHPALAETTSVGPPTNEQKVLSELNRGRWVLRTLNGVARDTEIEPAEVAHLLQELRDAGLVGTRTRGNGIRWYITDQGRLHLGTSTPADAG